MLELFKNIVKKIIGPEPSTTDFPKFKLQKVTFERDDSGNMIRQEFGEHYWKDGNVYDAMKFKVHHWGHNLITYRDKPPLFHGQNDFKDDVVYCNTCKRGFWY